MPFDPITITKDAFGNYDSDLFATLGQSPLSTTLTGYLLGVRTGTSSFSVMPPGTDIVLSTFNAGTLEYLRITSDDGEIWVTANFTLQATANAATITGFTARNPGITEWIVQGLIQPELVVEREFKRQQLMLDTNNIL